MVKHVKSQIKLQMSHDLDEVRDHQVVTGVTKPHTNGPGIKPNKQQGHSQSHSSSNPGSNSKSQCTQCNRRHWSARYPATGQRCRKCNFLAHFEMCCRTKPSKFKTVHEVDFSNNQSAKNTDSGACGYELIIL